VNRRIALFASVIAVSGGVALAHCGGDSSVGGAGADASADAIADASANADANGNANADANADAGGNANADANADAASDANAGLCSAATLAAAADAGRTLLFCDDFDEVTDPTTGWGAVFDHDAGTFSIDTTTFASAPHSARFAYLSDQFASFWMSQKVALPSSGTYTFAFDWYFDATPFEVEFMRATQLGAATNEVNLLAGSGSPSAVRFGVGNADYSDSGALATDAWHHVVVHVEGNAVHLTIDALDFGIFSFVQEAGASGSFEIEVSPDKAVDAAAVNAWFDNVEVTTP
jgi:hypothetical protein